MSLSHVDTYYAKLLVLTAYRPTFNRIIINITNNSRNYTIWSVSSTGI